jgi:hypothetical protein
MLVSAFCSDIDAQSVYSTSQADEIREGSSSNLRSYGSLWSHSSPPPNMVHAISPKSDALLWTSLDGPPQPFALPPASPQ